MVLFCCKFLGSRFWKTSKCIRAVRKSEVKSRKGKAPLALDSSSDSDFEIPCSTKRQRVVQASMEERLQKLEGEILSENADLRGTFSEKEKHLKAVQSRLTEVRQCFECLICKTQATFPAIVSPCCTIVIGCEGCVTQWLSTSSQCPHCRNTIALQECSKIPFIRNLADALGESSPSDRSSPVIEVD